MSISQEKDNERKDTMQVAIDIDAYDALCRMAARKKIKSIGTLAAIIIKAEEAKGAYTDFLG